ncbi:transposase [Streptomyces sp. TRM 70351]|uniref:transposase n=1 Tax=Streptomyces sp. TRM 70351 TaxID=3116552 RepID=UPI003FCE8E19
MGKYLKRWGLSFHRPDKRAVEQDPEAVRRWHEKTWPAIRAKAKKDGGEVLFADQVGIRSDQVTGRTWGEKGRTPVVRRSGNRFSVNAMSAISTKGRMHFMVFAESFTAEVMCRFLDRLAGHFDHKVLGLVRFDGHSRSGVQPREDVHHGEHGEEETSPSSFVHAGVQGGDRRAVPAR